MFSRSATTLAGVALCAIAIGLFVSSRGGSQGRPTPVNSGASATGETGSELRGNRSLLTTSETTSSSTISPAEEARIASDLQAAESLVLELERKSAVSKFKLTTGESVREGILVPELTVSELQPFYDTLTSKGGSYRAGTPAGNRFREQAGELLRKMGRRPAKYVERHLDTKTGSLLFKVIRMAPGTSFYVGNDGTITVNGKNTVSLNSDGIGVRHLFGQ